MNSDTTTHAADRRLVFCIIRKGAKMSNSNNVTKITSKLAKKNPPSAVTVRRGSGIIFRGAAEAMQKLHIAAMLAEQNAASAKDGHSEVIDLVDDRLRLQFAIGYLQCLNDLIDSGAVAMHEGDGDVLV